MDTKRKLNNLIYHLQSLEIEPNRKETSSTRSVKEITNFFENISKADSTKESLEKWNNDTNYLNKGSTIPFPNSLPFHNPGNMIHKNTKIANTVNFHSVWRSTVLNGGNAYCKNTPYQKSDATTPSGIKTSLRTSLVSCVMMLQYII